MDNQQETLVPYISGLFVGEGSIQLNKINVHGKILQYRGAVQFTNTEPEIAQKFVDFLKLNGWNYHVYVDKREYIGNSRVCYTVSLTKIKDRLAFLEKMSPFFIGKKVKEAEILIRFLKKRDETYRSYCDRSKTDGRFTSRNLPSFDEEQVKMYQDFKMIRGSPETTRTTPTFVG